MVDIAKVSKGAAEKLWWGNMISKVQSRHSLNNLSNGIKRLEKDLKRLEGAAHAKKSKKVDKALTEAVKHVKQIEAGQNDLARKLVQFTGRFQEDVQKLIDDIEGLKKSGYSPGMIEKAKLILTKILKRSEGNLDTQGALINDLRRKEDFLEDRSNAA
jgi:hypothetical protein